MKKICLSLATLVALSTSSFAASTLAEAFSEGKVNGELQLQYYNIDRTAFQNGSADLATLGIGLYYSTADYYGFKLNTGFQATHSPWATDEAKRLFSPNKNEQYGTGEVLSVFNLSYEYKDTSIAIGRMYLDLQNIATGLGKVRRVTYDAFEAIQVTNRSIANTELSAAYVTKYQSKMMAMEI